MPWHQEPKKDVTRAETDVIGKKGNVIPVEDVAERFAAATK